MALQFYEAASDFLSLVRIYFPSQFLSASRLRPSIRPQLQRLGDYLRNGADILAMRLVFRRVFASLKKGLFIRPPCPSVGR